jgi:hypothetical protein
VVVIVPFSVVAPPPSFRLPVMLTELNASVLALPVQLRIPRKVSVLLTPVE